MCQMASLGVLPVLRLSRFESYGNSTPCFPGFQSVEKRLATYDSRFVSSKTAGELAESGLFYIGVYECMEGLVKDCCRCFYCGAGFACWQESDDVQLQHVKKRPECWFARDRVPEVAPDADDEERMFQRWSSTWIAISLTDQGLPHCHLRLGLQEIYNRRKQFPSTSCKLLEIVGNAVEAAIVDTAADEDSLKCLTCKNQAIILFKPCGHVISCNGCSKKLTCAQCGSCVIARVVVRLA